MQSAHARVPVGVRLTPDQFLEFQRAAERHLAISITSACPLSCSHCLVTTVVPRDAARVTVPPERAAVWAAQMPELRRAGVQRISITGGEPFLAPEVLDTVSRGAAEAGIEVTVVTAAQWARGRRGIARTLARFAHIRRWHLSTDRFHAEFVPVARVIEGAAAALAAGHEVVLRVAVDDPPSEGDRVVLDEVAADLPVGAGLDVEPVLAVGRAAGTTPRSGDVDVTRDVARQGTVPCVSTGPVVRHDGGVSPCCGGLADKPAHWPWPLPDGATTGLAEVHHTWLGQPALRLVRALGFGPILQWIVDDGLDLSVPREPGRPCATCVALWDDERVVSLVRRRLASPAVRERIDRAYDAVFAAGGTDS